MFHPPRIGPISGVLTAPDNHNTFITGNDTGYCSFPILGPSEEIGPPSEGVVCPGDRSQHFSGDTGGTSGAVMYEIAGVLTTPVTSVKQLQTGLTYNTGPLTPGNGYFAAVMIESFSMISYLNFSPVPPQFGSAALVIDYDFATDVALSPEYVAGHRYFSLPNGSYDTTLIYNYAPISGWMDAVTIWRSNGQQPLIKQSIYGAGAQGAGLPTLTLPANPRAGNVLVFIGYSRDNWTSIVAPSGSWSTSGLLHTYSDANDHSKFAAMQMFWKTVCT